MTIDELKKSLGIHFHDADICGINLDFVNEEATFFMKVDPPTTNPDGEPPLRFGYLKLTGLLYCVIESPGAGEWGKEYIPSDSKLWIVSDSSDYSVLKNAPPLPYPLPENSFRHWFYNANDYNYIYVAAMNAQWEWKT